MKTLPLNVLLNLDPTLTVAIALAITVVFGVILSFYAVIRRAESLTDEVNRLADEADRIAKGASELTDEEVRLIVRKGDWTLNPHNQTFYKADEDETSKND